MYPISAPQALSKILPLPTLCIMTFPDTQVLIVGAGVVGLSASLFLAHHGISSIVIERRSGTSIHPRARSINQRTAELFRHLGLDETIHTAGKSIAKSVGIYTGPSLNEVISPHARKEGKREFAFASVSDSLGPVRGTFITQDILEPILLEKAKQRGVDVRFSVEYRTAEQDTDGVTVIVAGGENRMESKLRACYLVAADGAKSPIRSMCNISTTGQGTIGHMINILFRADLAEFVCNREFSLCKIEGPEVQGLFTSINNTDRWVFHLSYNPSTGEMASDFTEEKCRAWVQKAAGMPDLDIKIESILPWEPSVRVADTLRCGRIFLVGDAAHQMPPWGGQGANTGISDAYNLVWKLAAVLKKEASERLLDTYETERLPVAINAASASAAGADKRGMPSTRLRFPTISGALRKAYLVAGFGYQYQSHAICRESNWPLGGLTWKPWTLSSVLFGLDGRPGQRMPHLWVRKVEETVSTIDVLGKNFVLFTGERGAIWRTAASKISALFDILVDVYVVGPGGDLVSKGNEFTSAVGIAGDGAILVRPDDFVAWRERRLDSESVGRLENAARQILSLE